MKRPKTKPDPMLRPISPAALAPLQGGDVVISVPVKREHQHLIPLIKAAIYYRQMLGALR